MAQHTVFLLHGMGTFADGWAADYIKQLSDLWETYDQLKSAFPLKDTLRFVPLRYDDVFETWRTRLGQQNDLVAKSIGQLPGGVPFDRLIELTSKVTGKSFGATHLLDVALFSALPQFRSAVLSSLDAQIWKAIPDTDRIQSFSVIAHSLGTAVIQQLLQARADEQEAAGVWPPRFRVRTLLMLANVSRILELPGRGDVYESIVRPAQDPADGVCEIYLNGRNRLDPIWWPKELDPFGQWTWAMDPTVQRFKHLSFTHLASENPHALADYLAHPLIHGTLFRSLSAMAAIAESDLQKRIADYESKMPANLVGIASQLADLEFKNSLDSLLELMTKVDLLGGPK